MHHWIPPKADRKPNSKTHYMHSTLWTPPASCWCTCHPATAQKQWTQQLCWLKNEYRKNREIIGAWSFTKQAPVCTLCQVCVCLDTSRGLTDQCQGVYIRSQANLLMLLWQTISDVGVQPHFPDQQHWPLFIFIRLYFFFTVTLNSLLGYMFSYVFI